MVEGLGIMNYTLTAMGAKKLRQWFCLPTYDIDILEERQNAVAYFIEAENLLIRDQFRACLKLMNNIEYTVGRMKTSSNLSDWRYLLRVKLMRKIMLRDRFIDIFF
jgi:DNA mismatch repair ATPase MutS